MSTRKGGTKKSTGFHARLDERPEGKHSLEQRRGAPRRIANGRVRDVHVKVAHVDHDRIAVSHVRRLVPPVREPVDRRRRRRRWPCGARLEPPLQLRRLRRCAERAHRGFTVRVLGGCQVRANGLEVLGERGRERRDGEVRERGLVSEHRALLRVRFVALRKATAAGVTWWTHGPRPRLGAKKSATSAQFLEIGKGLTNTHKDDEYGGAV